MLMLDSPRPVQFTPRSFEVTLFIYIYRCYWFYLVSLQHFFLGADVRRAGILFSCFALGAVMVAYFLAAILPADPVISFLPETFNLGSA